MSYFICPRCQCKKVVTKDTRPTKTGVRRRRSCTKCAYTFTTHETMFLTDADGPLQDHINAKALSQSAKLLRNYADGMENAAKLIVGDRSDVSDHVIREFRTSLGRLTDSEE